jgi:hypothetical protein
MRKLAATAAESLAPHPPQLLLLQVPSSCLLHLLLQLPAEALPR